MNLHIFVFIIVMTFVIGLIFYWARGSNINTHGRHTSGGNTSSYDDTLGGGDNGSDSGGGDGGGGGGE